jgi:hypothetical protein
MCAEMVRAADVARWQHMDGEYAYRLEGILINKLKDAKAGAPQFWKKFNKFKDAQVASFKGPFMDYVTILQHNVFWYNLFCLGCRR